MPVGLPHGNYRQLAREEQQPIQYQLDLLEAEGYHPILSECIFTGQPLDWEAPFYSFSPQLGGMAASELRRKHQAETVGLDGLNNDEWVNVSTRTLRLLLNPHDPQWTALQFCKAQKFLRYYFQKVVEMSMHAYDLVLSLLETPLPEQTRPEQHTTLPAVPPLQE